MVFGSRLGVGERSDLRGNFCEGFLEVLGGVVDCVRSFDCWRVFGCGYVAGSIDEEFFVRMCVVGSTMGIRVSYCSEEEYGMADSANS